MKWLLAEFTAVTHVPISQLPPEYPEAHLQVYESFMLAVQTPPFRQGLLSHGPTAVEKKRQQHSIKYLHTFVAMDELFNINSSSNLLFEQQWHTFDDWWFLLRPNKQDLVAPKMQLLYIFQTLYLKNGVLNEFKVQKCLLVFIWHTFKLATFYSLPQLAQDPL